MYLPSTNKLLTCSQAQVHAVVQVRVQLDVAVAVAHGLLGCSAHADALVGCCWLRARVLVGVLCVSILRKLCLPVLLGGYVARLLPVSCSFLPRTCWLACNIGAR